MKQIKNLVLLLLPLFVASCSTSMKDSSGESQDPSITSVEESSIESNSSVEELLYYHYEATEPTCTKHGNKECWIKDKTGSVYLKKPSSNNIVEGDPATLADIAVKEYYIAPLGHSYLAPTYLLINDNTKVKATKVCEHDSSHIYEEVVSVISNEVITAATFSSEGLRRYYLADFADSTFTKEYIDEVIPRLTCNHANLEYVPSQPSTCTTQGHVEHWHCPTCDKYFSDEGLTVVSHDDVLLPIDSEAHDWNDPIYEPSSNNMKLHAYRTCKHNADHKQEEYVSAVFKEYKNGIEPTEYEGAVKIYSYTFVIYPEVFSRGDIEVKVPPLGHVHSMNDYVPEEPSTCTTKGHVGYYYCPGCEKYFSDLEGENEIEDINLPLKAHTLTHHDAKAPTCTETGNIEYWTCDECGKYFSNETGTNEIDASEITINPLTHNLVHYDAKAPTCTEPGNIEYWKCERCNEYFSDAEGQVEITLADTIISATGHSLTHHDAKAPTCTESGNIEYWTCDECGKYFSDAEGQVEITLADTIISATGHSLIHYLAKEPTCTEPGNYEVWYCENEETYYLSNPGGDVVTGTDPLPNDPSAVYYRAPKDHTLTHHDAKAPTCTEIGNIEYWTCDECGKYFSDAEGQVEIEESSIILPIDNDAHSWAGSTYSWSSDYKTLSRTSTCEHDSNHTKVDDVYVKANEDLYDSYTTAASELASNMHAGYKDPKKYGDVNLFFKYKNDVDDTQRAYDVDITLRFNRSTPIDSMNELFIIRVDNSFQYGLINTGSRDAYGIFYSGLDNISDGTKYTSTTATDNRNDYLSALVDEKGSFETDFKNFTQNVVVKMNAKLDMATKVVTVTATYYPCEADYLGYCGYTQTFETNVANDISNTVVNSIKIARFREDGANNISTSMILEDVTLNNGVYDHNIEGSKYTGSGWLGENFENFTIKTI